MQAYAILGNIEIDSSIRRQYFTQFALYFFATIGLSFLLGQWLTRKLVPSKHAKLLMFGLTIVIELIILGLTLLVDRIFWHPWAY